MKRKAVAAVVAATAGAAAAGVIVSRVRAGGSAPAPSGPEAEPLAELSKAELYRRAQAADIPGRSGMSKQQLARALRAAGA